MIRLFMEGPLAAGGGAALGPEQARYLTTVMRRVVGDEVALFNGRDGEWTARLAEVGKRGALLALEAQTRAQALGPDLELVVALVKRSRLETIVEKAAELGVRRVRPVITRRTNADHTRADRLRAIAVEASEQCGRLDVPEIAEPERLERLLDGWDEGRRLMMCDEGEGFSPTSAEGLAGLVKPALEALAPTAGSPPVGATARGSRALGGAAAALDALAPAHPDRTRASASASAAASVSARMKRHREAVDPEQADVRASPLGGGEGATPWAVLIGPEGGWAPEERERLAGLPFVTRVSLGPRILRADTAAISALTLWQAALGDWRLAPGSSTYATDVEAGEGG